MSLEAPGFITDLVPSNPTPQDPKAQGDDHLRNLKQTLQNSWPGINAAVNLTAAQLNALPYQAGDVVKVQLQADAGNFTTSLTPVQIGAGISWVPRLAAGLSFCIVECSFKAQVNPGNGYDPIADWSINQTNPAQAISPNYQSRIQSPGSTGGQGFIAPATVRLFVANDGVSRVFSLFGNTNNAASAVAAFDQVWTVTEVKL
jgi:hypothetical protein